jgi:hypothetical protein
MPLDNLVTFRHYFDNCSTTFTSGYEATGLYKCKLGLCLRLPSSCMYEEFDAEVDACLHQDAVQRASSDKAIVANVQKLKENFESFFGHIKGQA